MLLRTKTLLTPKVVEVAEVVLEVEVVEVEVEEFNPVLLVQGLPTQEQASHKVANCPYQSQARDGWWKSQLGNVAPSPVGDLTGNAQQEDKENC